MKLLLCLLLVSCTSPKDQFHALSKVVNARKGTQPVKVPEELR